LSIHLEFDKNCNLNSDDYSNSGITKSNIDNYEDAISDYKKSLDLNPRNKYTLNNRGYTYNIIEQYEKAIDDFDIAIEIEPEFAYSYNNRGLAKIKLGNEAEGLNDIFHSIDLDNLNSYAYRNLGIYYFDKHDFENARLQFEKALNLDKEKHLLHEYIKKTFNKLK
jgi:tetratricopeptide (TPR) repeat protein